MTALKQLHVEEIVQDIPLDIRNNPLLEVLVQRNRQLSTDADGMIAAVPFLKRLDLSSCKFAQAPDPTLLTSLTSLTALRLYNTEIAAESVHMLLDAMPLLYLPDVRGCILASHASFGHLPVPTDRIPRKFLITDV